MPTINQLSSTSSLSGGDQLPVYDASEGDARKASMSTLLAYIQSSFASPEFETQTAAPSSSGFTVSLDDSTKSIWLILNPTGVLATGTIQLPPDEDCFDGQVIVVVSSQEVSSLTVDGNGATVAGAPTAIGTNGFFSLRYQASATKWWCVAQSLGATGTFNDLTLLGDIIDGNGNLMMSFIEGGDTPAPGENNRLTVIYAENGAEVGLAATGDSTNIAISLIPKGTGAVNVTGSLAATSEVSAASSAIDEMSCLTIDVDTAVRHTVVTVAALGSAAPSGQRKFVSDANATTFASIVAGGGANGVPVYSDGTNWRIG